MNPSITISFSDNIPAWTIALVPISGEQVKDSRSICFLEFKEISPGVEMLLNDFKGRFFRTQSLEHWPAQASTTYFDNLIYVLDKLLPMYNLKYKVSDRPRVAQMQKPGGFFVGLIK